MFRPDSTFDGNLLWVICNEALDSQVTGIGRGEGPEWPRPSLPRPQGENPGLLPSLPLPGVTSMCVCGWQGLPLAWPQMCQTEPLLHWCLKSWALDARVWQWSDPLIGLCVLEAGGLITKRDMDMFTLNNLNYPMSRISGYFYVTLQINAVL